MAASAISDMKREQEFHARRGRRYEQPTYDGLPLYKPGDKLWVTERSLVYECEIVRVEKGQIHPDTNKKTRIPEYVVKFVGHNPKTELKDITVIEWDLFNPNNMPPSDMLYCGDHNRQMLKSAKPSELKKIIKRGLVFLTEEEVNSLEEARKKEKEKPERKEKQDKKDSEQDNKRKVSEPREKQEKTKKDAEPHDKDSAKPKKDDGNNQRENQAPDRSRQGSVHEDDSSPRPNKASNLASGVQKDKKSTEAAAKPKVNPKNPTVKNTAKAPTARHRVTKAVQGKQRGPKAKKNKRLQHNAKKNRANVSHSKSKAVTKISQRNKQTAKKIVNLAKKRLATPGVKANANAKRKRVA